MPKTADNPKPDSAELNFPSIPKDEGTSATENLAGQNLPPLEERYKKSSAEGIRLAKELEAEKIAREALETERDIIKNELSEFSDYASFIKSLKDDPKLVQHITSYWQPKEEENLQDLDLTDPKVFEEQVKKKAQEIVRNELATYKQSSAKESAMERQIQDFLITHPDKSRKDVEELIGWSKSNPMTLDHLLMLRNPEEFSKKVAQTTRTGITEQMRKIADTPASLATANSEGTPASPIDELFNAQKRRIDGNNLDIQTKSE